MLEGTGGIPRVSEKWDGQRAAVVDSETEQGTIDDLAWNGKSFDRGLRHRNERRKPVA